MLGHFRFYSKTPGFNAQGMFVSNYFIGGYAIHGYVDVPAYPASHGCLRVPIPDALSIYSWVRIGDRVDVYRVARGLAVCPRRTVAREEAAPEAVDAAARAAPGSSRAPTWTST